MNKSSKTTPQNHGKMSSRRKRYQDMNADELAEATREFDRDETTPPAIEPTAQEREALAQAYRRGRPPKSGPLMARVLITIDPELLAQIDRAAELDDLSRSGLITEALRMALSLRRGRVMGTKKAG